MSNMSPSVPGNRPVVDVANASVSHRAWEIDARAEQDNYEKWPVWVRIVVIIGLSALLWAGIISGVTALFSLAPGA
ncbi:MAG TPA: hypothetical protein PLR76_02310 [Hyphomonas sp.]|nr:hypothetical protein [Hyphomonas sp.]